MCPILTLCDRVKIVIENITSTYCEAFEQFDNKLEKMNKVFPIDFFI